MNTHEIEIEIDGIGVPATVTYTAEWYKGYKAPRQNGMQMEPDEPAHWQIDIRSIMANGVELWPLLACSEEWFAKMESELAEVENGYREGKGESAAEAKIEQMKEREYERNS